MEAQYVKYQVVRFRAHTETRERALVHIENRRTVDQWKKHVKQPEPEELEEKALDDERLKQEWRQHMQGSPDRGDTPDPDTLRQWEQDE
jgi:hypothetical protein